jgi:NADH-quinone oxidoreductase subunit K
MLANFLNMNDSIFTTIRFFNTDFVVTNIQYISLIEVLITSTLIFIIGMLGIAFNRKNLIVLLMSIELMLLGVSLNFVAFSIFMEDPHGQLYAMLILTLAAAESAIGLAILVVYYRIRKTISLDSIKFLRG